MEKTNKGIELTEAGKHLYRVWEKTEIVLVGENEEYYEVAKDMKKTFVR